jgi:hypothetical protein
MDNWCQGLQNSFAFGIGAMTLSITIKNRDTQHTVNTVLLSVANKPIMLSVVAPWHLPMQQGTLTEGQGSIRVTFSLRKLVL